MADVDDGVVEGTMVRVINTGKHEGVTGKVARITPKSYWVAPDDGGDEFRVLATSVEIVTSKTSVPVTPPRAVKEEPEDSPTSVFDVPGDVPADDADDPYRKLVENYMRQFKGGKNYFVISARKQVFSILEAYFERDVDDSVTSAEEKKQGRALVEEYSKGRMLAKPREKLFALIQKYLDHHSTHAMVDVPAVPYQTRLQDKLQDMDNLEKEQELREKAKVEAEAKQKDWVEQRDELMRKWREDIIMTSKGPIGPNVEAMQQDIVKEYDLLLTESPGSTQSIDNSWSNPELDSLNRAAEEIQKQCEALHQKRSAQVQTADTLPNLISMAFDVDPFLQGAAETLQAQLGGSAKAQQCETLKRIATIIEKCVTKYAASGDADRDVNQIKDISRAAVEFDTFAEVEAALRLCATGKVDGLQLLSLKNSFEVKDDGEGGRRGKDGGDPSDCRKPFVIMSDGRAFRLYRKQEDPARPGRCVQADPEGRGRRIELPYDTLPASKAWVYFNPALDDAATGGKGTYRTLTQAQWFYDFGDREFGWRDVLLNVRFPHVNDHICELQLHLRSFADVRNNGVPAARATNGALQPDGKPPKGHLVYVAEREFFGRTAGH